MTSKRTRSTSSSPDPLQSDEPTPTRTPKRQKCIDASDSIRASSSTAHSTTEVNSPIPIKNEQLHRPAVFATSTSSAKSSDIFSIDAQIEANNAADATRLRRRIKAVSLPIPQPSTVGGLDNENQLKKYKKKIEELEKKNRDLEKELEIWKEWGVFGELMDPATISSSTTTMVPSTPPPVRYADGDIPVDDMDALRARHRRWLDDIAAADAPEDGEVREELPPWPKIGR